MKIFVNQSTGKIEDSYLNTTPIEITTDIQLESSVSNKAEQVFENGLACYVDKDGNKTHDSFSISDDIGEFDFDDVSLVDGELTDIDEEISYAKTIKNEKLLENIPYITLSTITNKNAVNYNIDDILTQEIQNLLNDSIYDSALYDLLDSLYALDSTKYFKNKYAALVLEGGKINIKEYLKDNVILNDICIKNIPKNCSVILNNIALEFNEKENGFIGKNINVTEVIDLYITSIDESTYISYPYILYN